MLCISVLAVFSDGQGEACLLCSLQYFLLEQDVTYSNFPVFIGEQRKRMKKEVERQFYPPETGGKKKKRMASIGTGVKSTMNSLCLSL
jgi:hypothetical protein